MTLRQIKVYRIKEVKELENGLYDTILDKYRNINVEGDWYDGTLSCFLEGNNTGFNIEYDNILFSGFYSQGDGASFTGTVDIIEFLKKNRMLTKFKNVINYIEKDLDSNFEIEISRDSHFYYHENTTSFDGIELSFELEYSKKKSDIKLRASLGELETIIEDKRKELCLHIYKLLNKDYDYFTKDETVCETLDINEYQFTTCGNIFSECEVA